MTRHQPKLNLHASQDNALEGSPERVQGTRGCKVLGSSPFFEAKTVNKLQADMTTNGAGVPPLPWHLFVVPHGSCPQRTNRAASVIVRFIAETSIRLSHVES